MCSLFNKEIRVGANYNTSIALFGLTGKVVEKEALADSWTSDTGEICRLHLGHGTVGKVFTGSQMTEEAWEFTRPAYTCFVDSEQNL